MRSIEKKMLMNTKYKLIVVLVVMALLGVTGPVISGESGKNPLNYFSFNLFKQAILKYPDINMVMSPLSAAIVLASVGEGSEGKTREQIQKLFSATGTGDLNLLSYFSGIVSIISKASRDVHLYSGNSLWIQKGLAVNPEFKRLTSEKLDTALFNIDFSGPNAVKTINNWISRKTFNKLKDVVQSLDAKSIFTLVNTIYFKSYWHYPFTLLDTPQPFWISKKQSVPVKYMTESNHYLYSSLKDGEVISVPYGYDFDRFALVIYLPKRQKDINKIFSQLTEQSFWAWVEKMSSHDVVLEMPVFKIENRFELNAMLSDLGLSEAFLPTAQINRIVKDRSLSVGHVIHQAIIEVDEKGTEAAAATVLELNGALPPDPNYRPIYMTVDRPFFYAIIDQKSANIAFMGVVKDPSH